MNGSLYFFFGSEFKTGYANLFCLLISASDRNRRNCLYLVWLSIPVFPGLEIYAEDTCRLKMLLFRQICPMAPYSPG